MTRDASMKHLADFFPLRGGEVSVHVLQRARVESFDLGKKRFILHMKAWENFGRGVRLFIMNGRSPAQTSFG